jgi:exodeoxyribonuclease V beta subunit
VADLCLARLWPEFAALEAQAGFADVAERLYGPLLMWLGTAITIRSTGSGRGSMSSSAIPLRALEFPLHGSRLIEASAGTGKTWTIAALYVRLVLGHGGAQGYQRPLLPAEILVMTFTRAATRELSNRVRERLVEAAAYFRAYAAMPLAGARDAYLDEMLQDYPDAAAQQQAAHRLMLAAETMDEAAIFTIDAWCQRMLREHADSGSLFDEELVSDEQTLFEDAAHDYWRQHVYPLNAAAGATAGLLGDVGALKSLRELTRRADRRQPCGRLQRCAAGCDRPVAATAAGHAAPAQAGLG